MASDSKVKLSPPPKRFCEETVPDEIKRHESVYFTDGDIVLLSLPNDHVVTAFRVDKIYLSRHSPVFKDMFSLPSPDDVDMYDGVPLVRLQDETEHLVSFLNALYNPSTIPYKKYQSDTVSRVEGTLKLCIKYQVDDLRSRIVGHLIEDWPTDFATWDIVEKDFSARNFFTDDKLPEPCSIIRLARECDIPQILPAAFYRLSRIPPTADLDTPSNISELLICGFKIDMSRHRRARFALLSRDDFKCLVKGSRAMAKFVHEHCSTNFRDCAKLCRSKEPEPCRNTVLLSHKKIEDLVLQELDPLRAFEDVRKTLLPCPKSICAHCHSKLLTGMSAGRSKLWGQLPKFFGLVD